MLLKIIALSVAGIVAGGFVYGQFVPERSFRSPSVAILHPSSNEMVMVASRVTRTGIRIPDMSGWSEGSCLIKGSCTGTAEQVAWKIDFNTQQITLIPVPDEKVYFCQTWPFAQPAGPLYDFNLNISTLEGKEIVPENVSWPFNSCTVYAPPQPGDEAPTKTEMIFGSTNFSIGLPERWMYISNNPSGLRGILHAGKFVDISTNQPVFTSPPERTP